MAQQHQSIAASRCAWPLAPRAPTDAASRPAADIGVSAAGLRRACAPWPQQLGLLMLDFHVWCSGPQPTSMNTREPAMPDFWCCCASQRDRYNCGHRLLVLMTAYRRCTRSGKAAPFGKPWCLRLLVRSGWHCRPAGGAVMNPLALAVTGYRYALTD
jgi:hypothetical protein